MSNTEAVLLKRLQACRWKHGLRCPRCGHAKCSLHARGRGGHRKLRCAGCGRTFTDLTGTPLAGSHLPLTSWSAAARLMLAGRPTCSDLSIKLKVRLSTAWRMRKILALALNDADLRQVLVSEESL